MIRKEKILIWTICSENWFRSKHKLNKNSSDASLDEFKNIKFTNFNVFEKDVTKSKDSNDLPKYYLSQDLWEEFKIENLSHYDVIIFDLKCLMAWMVNYQLVNFSINYFVENILFFLIKKYKNKNFLILNADQKNNLDNVFNELNLEKRRSSKIKSFFQTNINEKNVSHYCLNNQETKKNKNIKKYRPLWHATGNKNEITGFQVDNMYLLPFGCDALSSILDNIDSLFDDSNEFNEKKIFNLLKTKDPDYSLKDLPVINDFWKKHSKKEELMKNFSESKQELTEHALKVALFLKPLEYTGKNLEEIIKKNLEKFKFEILPQNKKNTDQADIIFSFNYNQSKYITLVEVKGYEKNKIKKDPFEQLRNWNNNFIAENKKNQNKQFNEKNIIKLAIINNGCESSKSKNYDQRVLMIHNNIKKFYDNKFDNIKVITTLNLIKILYSDEEHGAELLKKKLVSTKDMQIEFN